MVLVVLARVERFASSDLIIDDLIIGHYCTVVNYAFKLRLSEPAIIYE